MVPTPVDSNYLYTARPNSSFTFSPRTRQAQADSGLDWLDAMLEGSGVGSVWSPGEGAFGGDQAILLAQESPENAPTISSAGLPPARTTPRHQASLLATTSRRELQLEDVTSWANISHFISLYLQYLYPLTPLVHRPTFAEHLATRRDLRDIDFRALLLSIGE